MINRDENGAKIFCIHEKWKRGRKMEIEIGFQPICYSGKQY
jgi:hypothetical protein